MIGELLTELATPLRGLLVALSSVLLAYLWYDHQHPLAILIGVIACLVGLVLDQIGKRLLPLHPVPALWFLEGWVLMPAALAAVAGAVVVIIAVALTVPDSAAASTKQTISALSAGLTAFITAGFISWAGDDKDSKVADHIKAAFREKYDRVGGTPKAGVHYFATESAGESWVYSDEYAAIEGWGHSARATRAKGIKSELSSGGSEPG